MEAGRVSNALCAWEELSSAGLQQGALAARLVRLGANTRVFAGVDPDGNRHVLLQLHDGEDGFEDVQSRGIGARTVLRAFAGEMERRFIDIVCTERDAQAMLDVLVADMIHMLEGGETQPDRVVKAAFSKWRRIWAQVPKPLLSRNEQAGLFAELWFLAFWLMPFAGADSITRWRGPLGSRHDFEWRGRAVEAKATLSHTGRVHVINGIDQLDNPEDGDLFLFSQRLREEGGAENNLPSLIGRIRHLLARDGEALDIFDGTLSKSGYHDVHADDYSRVHYRVVDEILYRVSKDFPRLTASELKHGLPSAIQAVQYELNLQGQDGYIVANEPAQAREFLV